LTATEFLRLMWAREISVVDYVTACADQIDRVEDKVQAWTWYDRDLFIARAREADADLARVRANGVALPAAYGVPLGVKDVFNTLDMPTGHGSTIFASYTPGNDARVVTNMRRAGALVAGKTVTAEFAVHAPGKTHNPLDLRRSCGTSSSGSAAAVASFMVPIALGSQTAGSTVRPSSYMGICGFKPSFGLLPRTAMLKTTDTLDTVGLMARSPADLALAFEIMRVRGPNYPIVDREMNDPVRLKKAPGPWRVGVVTGPKSGLECQVVREGMRTVADRLQTEGHMVESVRLPAAFDAAHDVHETIYRKALAYYFKGEWSRARSEFSGVLGEMIESGFKSSPEVYHHAVNEQFRLARTMDDFLRDFDVMICPATADEAPIGISTPDIPDHNLIWTMCHLPSFSLPLLSGSSGLPVGLQVTSRRFNDYLVIEFSNYLMELVRGAA
jgi:Asp-tRNA(Asn)/Glu-tRNA(Gln) amidotransferase A subunit family amidase